MKVRARKRRLATRGVSERELWREKRARQVRDRQGVREGRVAGEDLRWFRDGAAKRVTLISTPL